jgi:hypothetical protein
MKKTDLKIWLILILIFGILVGSSCAPLGPAAKVIVVTVTPTPTLHLPPPITPLPGIVSPDPVAPPPTPTNIPELKIVKYQIIDYQCQGGKVKAATIQLIITGGELPYDYRKNTDVDANGEAMITVTSKDGQTVERYIKVSQSCNSNGNGNGGTIDPTSTNTPKPPTEPPPTNTPNPPPKECNDKIDNDGDGFTDYPADSQCTKNSDDSEGY